MKLLGSIKEIWRYPVSSLGGEQLESVEITHDGISQDRTWCLADAITKQPAAPEKEARWRPAVFLLSRLTSRIPEIGFPDGTWLSIEDPEIVAELRAHFGFEVSVLPYAKACGLTPDDHVATNRYDPSPVHLLTTSSLDILSVLASQSAIDSRRFRPTITLQTSVERGFLEKAWIGKPLRIGQTAVIATEETKRCGMTLIAQPGLAETPEILRSILRHNRRNFGIYCTIDTPGVISIGDPAYIHDV